MNHNTHRFSWGLSYALLSCVILHANPIEPLIEYGFIECNLKSAKTLCITTSDKIIMHCSDFSIAADEVTEFVQPSANSIAIIQVEGEHSSILSGTLKANGNIVLINSHGIVIGENCNTCVGGLIASSLLVCCPYALMSGIESHFEGDSKAKIIHTGRIKALNGDVTLISHQIENKGSIDSLNGITTLAAGKEIILQPLESEKTTIFSSSKAQEAKVGIDNEGLISACQIELRADGNLYEVAIRQRGFINAMGASNKKSEVSLFANQGAIHVFGAISSENADKTGGNIQILGKSILLKETAHLDASGDRGGGKVLIGKNQESTQSTFSDAMIINLNEGSTIYADALENGNGGHVSIWSDGITTFQGEISACGGENSGDGGYIEFFGKDELNFNGEVDIDAPYGISGDLVLHPSQ